MKSKDKHSSKKLKKREKHMNFNRRIDDILLYPAMKNAINGKFYGYINRNGDFIIEPKYDKAYKFNQSGFAIVEEKDMFGIINSKGEYVIEPKYQSISPYNEGRAIFVLKGKMGVIDEKGNKVTKRDYDFIRDYKEERAVVGEDKGGGFYSYGYIDKDGNEIVTPKFETADDFNEGMAVVKLKNKEYGLIDKNGHIIDTYNYDYVGDYGDGFMVFSNSMDQLYGYINIDGKEVIEQKYKIARRFQDGTAVVSEEEGFKGNYGLIGITGEYIYQPIYSEIKQLGEKKVALGMPIGENKISNVYAIADNKGQILTNFKYLQIGNYKDGLAYASDATNTFFINEKGELNKDLPSVKGSGELSFEDNIIFADIDFSPYYLSKEGKILYEPNNIIKLDEKIAINRLKNKPNVNYLAYIPQIEGIINEKVKENINFNLKKLSRFEPFNGFNEGKDTIDINDVLEYSYYGDFKILFYKKNLLVLDIYGYYYPFGAAHGMGYRKTPNINLATGEFYSLEDLFKKDVDWMEQLNYLIKDMIKNNPEYMEVYPDSFKGIKKEENFYVDEQNLYIYFMPYELAPYAAGIITFKIPFSKIQELINKEGDFYKAFD